MPINRHAYPCAGATFCNTKASCAVSTSLQIQGLTPAVGDPGRGLSGDVNHLRHVLVLGIAAYDADDKRLIAGTQLFDVSSSFALEELRFTTALPLAYER